MKNYNTPDHPAIVLRNLEESDTESFIDVVNDPAIIAIFPDFKDRPDNIPDLIKKSSTDLSVSQRWGVFLPDHSLIGFVVLQRSPTLRNMFEIQKMKQSDYDVDLDELIEIGKSPKKQEAKNKATSPYVLEIAIGKKYRGQGFAQATVKAVADYALKAGLSKLHFVVAIDNFDSLKMVDRLGGELVIDSEIKGIPKIFEYPLDYTVSTDEELTAIEQTITDKDEQNVFKKWRWIVREIPELTPQKELVMMLLRAILSRECGIGFDKNTDQCKISNFLGDLEITIGLKRREASRTIIWSLAHEFGHLLQDPRTEAEQVLYSIARFEREVDAWARAKSWLADKPYFIYNWADFYRFQISRVSDYLPPQVEI